MKIIELLLDKSKDNTGISAVSFVKKPAIEVAFMFFSANDDEEKKMHFALDDEQGIVSGPALIPNKKIYRNAETMGGEEAYVFFSEDTVVQCATDFLKNNRNNYTTLEHTEPTTSMTLRESWLITDPTKDKSVALGFKNLPKNTWMLSYQLDKNGQEWQDIKAGKYNGFSVEATFIQQMMSEQKPLVKQKYRCISTKNKKLKNSYKYRKIKSPRVSLREIGEQIKVAQLSVKPEGGEDKNKFMSRCIAFYVNEGKEQDQASAICYATWDKK